MYISEAASCGDTGVCVGGFHTAEEYSLFWIMAPYSLVVGGTGILKERW